MLVLSESNKISIIVNSVIFLCILIGSIIFLTKVKFEAKGYKFAYIFYIMFWIPVMLVRNLNGNMQKAIGQDIDLMWIVLSAYGFVGIFIRVFADYLYFLTRYRKAFLLFAIIMLFITYIPIIAQPSTATNIIQVIGVGIGASCIGTYQLLFKEQFSKQKDFLAVSLLSIPPIMANFLTAPIRSLMNATSYDVQRKDFDPEILKYTWLIGLFFVLITFIMFFFVKEIRAGIIPPKKESKITNNIYNISSFVLYSIAGLLILFIRFSNSGSVASLHLNLLNQYTDQKSIYYESYLTIVHNLFQLIAGVMVGTLLIKRINYLQIILIGGLCFILYHTLAIFAITPIAFFSIHMLNGFAYGLVYNTLLSIVIVISLRTNKVSAMGIYQSILAIGITLSGPFVSFVKLAYNNGKNLDKSQFLHNNLIYNVVLLSLVSLSMIMIEAAYILNQKYQQKLQQGTKSYNQLLV